ncbi:MAG: hypothetical protein JSR77_06240 [Planctomycetes bacterium]|nr:hypothetical protein [Planctomycetota bacterium]
MFVPQHHLRFGLAAFAAVCSIGLADPPPDPPQAPPADVDTPKQPDPSPPPAEAKEPAKRPSIIKPEKAPEPSPQTPVQPSTHAATGEPIETEVLLKDGRKVIGILVERTEDEVVLSIAGLRTVIPAKTVEKLSTLPTIDEQYKQLKNGIDPGDAEGLTRLAEWLRSHDRLDAALEEVERALAVEPTLPEARQLKTLIQEQKKLWTTSKPKSADASPKPKPVKEEAKQTPFPLLTEDQINLIRVYEIDLENPPKLVLSRDAINEFMDKFAGTRVEGRGKIPSTPEERAIFAKKSPAEILAYMFDVRAREFYGRVKVMDNPKSMQLFLDNVNRGWLINSCATSRCHGGEEAGRLRLYDKKPSSNVAAYTNFLILERFRIDDKLPMIDYAEPANSPLLQYGLPRDDAKFKHPEVGGGTKARWKPAFRSTEDEKFQKTVEWIRSMYPKRTEYPIEYTPPQGAGMGKAPESDHVKPR